MKQIFFADERQNDLARKGYAVVPLLARDEAAQLILEIDELLRGYDFTAESQFYFYPNHISFLSSDAAYKRRVAELVERVVAPRLNRFLADYRAWGQSFYIKPPGGPEIALHNDWTFAPNLQIYALNLWCPLVDVDETNGALQVVAGSHKLWPNINGPGVTPYFGEFAATSKKLARPVPLRAGEALIFENSILHGSTPNNSTITRYAITSLCLPKEVRPALYYPVNAANGPVFEVYEVDNEVFITHSSADFLSGNIRAPRLRTIPNHNQTITEQEFLRRLAS